MSDDQIFLVSIARLGADFNFQPLDFPSLEADFFVVGHIPDEEDIIRVKSESVSCKLVSTSLSWLYVTTTVSDEIIRENMW